MSKILVTTCLFALGGMRVKIEEYAVMKELVKEVNISYGDLVKILIAPIRSKLLLTGVKLKVFNQLSEPKSAEAVAKIIGTHLRNTKLFLDGLTAIDLLQKENEFYRNSPIAQAFLVEGNPTYLGNLCLKIRDDPVLENLLELVRDGPPPIPETTFSGELSARYADIWVSTERAGDAQLVVRIVSELPEFASFRNMLDLGGGPGIIGMAIVAAHPRLKGVVFDLPPVVKVAEDFIKKYKMEDRMDVLGGDFNCDSIGEKYDFVLACSCLQFARDLDSVVKKIYDALNPGGVFASFFGFGLTCERTKPEFAVLSMLATALLGQDVGVKQGFIADSMLRVGFKSVHSQLLDTPWGPWELDIARK